MTMYKCIDCADFDLCHSCIHQAGAKHNADHHFRPRGNTVYYASSGSYVGKDEFDFEVLSAPSPGGCVGLLVLPAIIVDTIKTIAANYSAHFFQSSSEIGASIPLKAWSQVPGMEDYVDEHNAPTADFFRTMIGNRMLAKAEQPCFANEAWLKEGLESFKGSLKEGSTTEVAGFSEQRSACDCLSSMSVVMASRILALTENSVGFVP